MNLSNIRPDFVRRNLPSGQLEMLNIKFDVFEAVENRPEGMKKTDVFRIMSEEKCLTYERIRQIYYEIK
jgi:hypothetical protein